MCGGPQWKREVVPDHKFDFIDTRDFTDHSCWMRTRYLWVYILVLKSFLVYVFDIFTAITMLTTENWSNHIFDSCKADEDNGCVFIPFTVGKWLFVGCIICSFLLLAYEARKARKIIQSRDISYAFTNIMANNYYSLRSYDHFCFFCHINESTKKIDDFAFFIFFTFKDWKRLLLADGPRQVINGLTLYSFYLSQKDNGSFWDLDKYTNGSLLTGALIFSTLTTVAIFAGSALLLLAAGIGYIPLLCYIRGNLKEYCCHKVDKRISEIVKRKNKERLAQAAKLARKEAAGDFSHLKNKKGELIHNPLPQPTLPNVKLDDDDFDDQSMRTRVPPSTYTAQSDYYYNSDYKGNYPEYPPGGFDTYGYNQAQYNDSESVTRLATAAAPIAGQNDQNAGYSNYVVDPNDTYYATGANGYPNAQGQYGQGQYDQGQYNQGQYSQGQYGQDQYSQQQYYGQDQYAQQARQGGQGHNTYATSQQGGQYAHYDAAYDPDLGTPVSGMPYDQSERGSSMNQGRSQYDNTAGGAGYSNQQLHRGPSAQAGNPSGGRAR